MTASSRPRLQRRLVVALACLLAAPALASAHDFWLEPSAFRVQAGELVRLALRVGHAWEGEPVRRTPSRFERFVLLDEAGETAVLGVEGADPAGLARPAGRDGLRVVAYRGTRVTHRMEGPAFERYLGEEGLAHVSASRKARHASAAAGREVYSRCAKALIAVGDSAGGGFDRLAGLTLELVPEGNPYTHVAGEALPFRLLFEGAPVADVLVQAVARETPDQTLQARTDAEGRVRLPLGHSGGWLVKAVHMVPAPSGLDADWESFWASLTFEIPPAGSTRR